MQIPIKLFKELLKDNSTSKVLFVSSPIEDSFIFNPDPGIIEVNEILRRDFQIIEAGDLLDKLDFEVYKENGVNISGSLL